MRPFTIALLALWAAGCATPQASGPSPTAEAPPSAEQTPATPQVDLKAMIARELAPLPLQNLRAEGAGFSGSIEGIAAPKFEPAEAGFHLNVNVGARAALFCLVQPEGLDAASTLSTTLSSLPKTVEVKQVRPVEVVAVQGAPAMFVEVDYLVDVEGGKALGQIKLMTWSHAQTALFCHLDDVGYSESFRRILKGFASSIRFDAPLEEAPRYTEVQVVRLQDLPVGFSVRTVFPRADGLERTHYVSAMLFVRSPTEVMGVDTITLEWADEAGHVAKYKYVKALNNELVSNLDLKRTGTTYAYSGTFEGKPLEGTFESKDALAGEVLTWKLVRADVLGKKKAEVKRMYYSPGANPVAPTPISFRPSADGDRNNLLVELGPLKVKGRADEHGVPDYTEIDMGRLKVVSERLYSQGTP